MRLDGKVLLQERKYEESADVLDATIRLHGPDAGTQAELGRADELAGRGRAARDAYGHSLLLQPDNRDVSAALGRLADSVAAQLYAEGAYRRAGQDRLGEVWAKATKALASNERVRLGAALGFAEYSGRADAVNAGATDVDADVVHLQAAAFWHFARLNTLAAGLAAYPGAPGDFPLGGWARLHLLKQDPYRSLEVGLFGHLLLDEPTAAPGLGGRTSGLRAAYARDVGRRFWASAEVLLAYLSIDNPSADDPYFRGAFTFGWRVVQGEARVAPPLDLTRASLPGLVGTHLTDPPKETPGPEVSLWVTYEPVRLLGNEELAALLPIGTRFDYLTLGARGDFHLAPAWGAKLEGYFGTDLAADEPIFGVEGGLTWRPSYRAELTLVGGYGTALGRADDVDSFHVRLGFSWRW